MSVPDTEKLAKIAGMFGSDHDGERAAAALKFDAALKAEGLSFGDLLKRAAEPRHVPEPVSPVRPSWMRPPRPVHQEKADAVFASPLVITDWEREFLATVRVAPTISAKQTRILSRLYSNAVGADYGRM